MEISGDLVTERELACFITLTGLPGITSPIVSLFQTCRRQRHPKIKRKVAALALVDVAVSK